jgi:hypothetical protein
VQVGGFSCGGGGLQCTSGGVGVVGVAGVQCTSGAVDAEVKVH